MIKKKSIKKIAGSEDFYRTLLENTADIIHVIDHEGTILYVNPPVKKILRYMPSKMTGMKLIDFIHSADHLLWKRLLGRVRDKAAVSGEIRVRHKDDSWHIMKLHLKVLEVSTADPLFIVTLQDITDHRQAEQFLVESETKFKLIAENSPVGLYIIQDDIIRYCNPCFNQIFGFEMLGRNIMDFVLPEDVSLVLENIRQRESGEADFVHYQFRGRTQNGEIKYIEVFGGHTLYRGKRAVLGSMLDVTERKQKDETLRKREEHYRLLAENTSDVVWVIDVRTMNKHLYVSPSIEKFSGYTHEEYMQLRPRDILAPESAKRAEKYFTESLRQAAAGKPVECPSFEIEAIRKNGESVWAELTYALIYDDSGRVVAVQGADRDITQRKKAEEDLRANEAKYRFLTENMEDIIWMIDLPSFKLSYISPSVQRILGFSIAEFSAMDGLGFILPQSLPAIRQAIKMLGKDPDDPGKAIILEYKTYKKDGTTIWLEATGRPIFDAAGTVIGIQGASRDINDRKKVEEALRESEEQYRLIAETAHDVVWLLDARTFKYLYISPSVDRIFGYTREEMLKMDPLKRVSPATANVSRESLQKALSNAAAGRPEECKPFEQEITCKDGSIIWVAVTYRLVSDADGNVVAIRGSSREITEQKKAERALKKSEEQYRLLAENTDDIVWMIDSRTFDYIYVSPSVERYSGYSREEYIKLPAEDMMTAESLAKVRENFTKSRRQAAAGLPVECPSFDAQGIRKDKSKVWTEISYNLVYDSTGKVTAIQGISRNIDERKKIEEALRQSEERYRILADNMSDVVWVIDTRTFKHSYISPSIERFTDYTREEYMQLLPRDVLTPESAAKATEYFTRSLRQAAAGEPAECPSFEIEAISRSGVHVWAEINYRLVYDDSHKVVAIQGVDRDITDRKKAEEALRKNEEQYRLLAENMVDLIWMVDAGTLQFTYLSPSIEKISGYTKEEFLHLRWQDIITPSSFKAVKSSFKSACLDALAGRKIECAPFELEVLHKNGDVFWTDVSYTPVFNQEGKLTAFQGIHRNITERKALEEALRESERKHRLLVENTHDIIYMVDKEGVFTYVSPAWTRLLGHEQDQVIGKPAHQFIHHKDYPVCIEFRQALIEQRKGPRYVEYRVRHANGAWYWHASSGTRLDDRDGLYNGYYGVARDITERKKAEEALRESEKRYRLLVDSIGDMILYVDLASVKISYISPSVKLLLGYSSEELLGENASVLMCPQDYETLIKYIASIANNVNHGTYSEHPVFETDLIRKDGTAVKVEATFSWIRNEAGEIIAVQSVNRDITERKRIQEVLRESEQKFQLLAENMNDFLWIADPHTLEFRYLSPGLQKLTGYTPEEFKSLKPPDFFTPTSRKILLGSFRKAVADATAGRSMEYLPIEIQAKAKDGTTIWEEVNYSLVINADGVVTALQGINRDITERKKAAEDLRKSEERYRLLADNMSDFIFLIELPSLKCLYVSPSVQKATGYSVEEVMNMSVASLNFPEDYQRLHHYIMHTMKAAELGKEPESVTFDGRVICKDGSVIWVEAVFSWIRDGSGRIIAGQSANRDITERKKAEEVLAARTADLARSNAELEHFAYIASHDLQEPLRMVASFTELLARRYQGKLGSDADEFISYAVDGAKRMKQLINDLLAYSRVGTRGNPLIATDCRAVLAQAKTNLAMVIEENRAMITAEELPTIDGDEVQLTQLFQNLIGNAVKFHGHEPPAIEIRAEKQNEEWLFSVADNGIGIEPQHYENIFTIFTRIHGRKDYPGTGIGLAICKKIVERHGGRIWVTSGNGHGSTFFFTLPLAGGLKNDGMFRAEDNRNIAG